MDFLQKLDFLMEKYGLNKLTLSQNSGIPYSTIVGWYKKGYEGLKLTTLKKLSDYFNTVLDYWINEDEIDPNYWKANGFIVNGDEMGQVQKYRLLDPYGKEAVDSVLDVEFRRCEADRQDKSAALREIREQMEMSDEIVPPVKLHQPYAQVAAAEGAGAFLLDDGYEEIAVEMNEYTKKADVILKVVGRSMEPIIADGDRVLVRQQPSVNIGEIGVFILDGQGYLKERAVDRLLSLNPDIEDVYIGDLQQAECYGKFIKVLDPDWVK